MSGSDLSPRDAEARARPLWVAVFGFALWTLCSQITVLRGGTLDDLLWLFAGAVVIGLFVVALAGRSGRWTLSRDPLLEPGTPGPEARRRQGRLFMVLAVAVMVLTAVAHRDDTDDSSYLNLAVSVVDDPSLPIMTFDQKHDGPFELRIRTASRLRSFEMVSAAYARLTGRRAIEMAHLVIPPLAALFCLSAYRFLFQLWLPGRWFSAVAIAVLFLLADGGTHQSYGNFSFVRLQQGKSLFLTGLVPLLLAAGSRFVQAPTRGRFAQLVALQVAAVGLSSTAMLVVPLVLCQLLAASLPWASRTLSDWKSAAGTAAWGATSLLYVVGCAVISRLPVLQAMARDGAAVLRDKELPDVTWLSKVFGETPIEQWSRIAILLCLPFLLRPGLARRFSVVAAASLSVLLVADGIAETLVRYWVKPWVLWRLLWGVPLPALVALFVLSPLDRWTDGRFVWARRVTVAVLVLLMLGPMTGRSILHPENRVRLSAPGFKVPSAPYAMAEAVTAELEPGAVVLAPTMIGAWLPTFHRHAYPVLTVEWEATRSRFGEEWEDRLKLTRWIDAPPAADGFPERRFGFLLERFRVQGVVLRERADYDVLRRILADLGYVRRLDLEGFELWARPQLDGTPKPSVEVLR